MTFTKACVVVLTTLSLFAIFLGFFGWALLMDARWCWLIGAGFVLLLCTAFAEWLDEHYYY